MEPRILILDEPFFAEPIVDRVKSDYNCEADTTKSLEKGLQLLREKQYRAIVMEPYELVSHENVSELDVILDEADARHIPVIIFSSRDNEQLKELGLDLRRYDSNFVKIAEDDRFYERLEKLILTD